MKLTPLEESRIRQICLQYRKSIITQEELTQYICELLNLSEAEFEQFDLTPYFK